jgi:hypothetical protein
VFKPSTARKCDFQNENKEEGKKKIMAVNKEKPIMMKGNKNNHSKKKSCILFIIPVLNDWLRKG